MLDRNTQKSSPRKHNPHVERLQDIIANRTGNTSFEFQENSPQSYYHTRHRNRGYVRDYFNDRHFGKERIFLFIGIPLTVIIIVGLCQALRLKEMKSTSLIRASIEANAHR